MSIFFFEKIICRQFRHKFKCFFSLLFFHEEIGIVHRNMRFLVVCCSNLKFSSAEINKNDHNIIFNELTTIASIELRLFYFFFAKTSISFGLLHSYLVYTLVCCLFLQNCVVFIFAITRSVKCGNIIRFIAHISIKSVVSSQKKPKCWYKTNKIFVFHGIKWTEYTHSHKNNTHEDIFAFQFIYRSHVVMRLVLPAVGHHNMWFWNDQHFIFSLYFYWIFKPTRWYFFFFSS